MLRFVISAASGHLVELIKQKAPFYHNDQMGSTMRRLDILKAKKILRLKHEVLLFLREIGQACNCGKTTVTEVLDRTEKACIIGPIELRDKQLMSMFLPSSESTNYPSEPNLEYVFREIMEKVSNACIGGIQGKTSL